MTVKFDPKTIKLYDLPQASVNSFLACNCQNELATKTSATIEKILQHPKFLEHIQNFKQQLPDPDKETNFHIRINRTCISITPLDPALAHQTRTLNIDATANKELFDLDNALVDKAKEVWQAHQTHHHSAPPNRSPKTDSSTQTGSSPRAPHTPTAAPPSPHHHARRQPPSFDGPVGGVGFRVHKNPQPTPSTPLPATKKRTELEERVKQLNNNLFYADTFERLRERDPSTLINSFVSKCPQEDKNKIYCHTYLSSPPPATLKDTWEYGQNSFLSKEGYTLSNEARARAMRNFVLEELALLTIRSENTNGDVIEKCFKKLPQQYQQEIAAEFTNLIQARQIKQKKATSKEYAQSILNYLAKLSLSNAVSHEHSQTLQQEIAARQQRVLGN